jgi:polyphosphate kinase
MEIPGTLYHLPTGWAVTLIEESRLPVRIYDKHIQQELNDMLSIQHNDSVKARIIDEEQENTYVDNGKDKAVRSQFALYDYYKSKLKHNK